MPLRIHIAVSSNVIEEMCFRQAYTVPDIWNRGSKAVNIKLNVF
jgi:hypothetical protein